MLRAQMSRILRSCIALVAFISGSMLYTILSWPS